MESIIFALFRLQDLGQSLTLCLPISKMGRDVNLTFSFEYPKEAPQPAQVLSPSTPVSTAFWEHGAAVLEEGGGSWV